MTAHAPRWLALVGAITCLLALSAACGGGSDDAGPTATQSGGTATGDNGTSDTPAPTVSGNTDVAGGVNACDLLSKEEVEAALGQPASQPQAGASGPYETCTWNTQDVSLKFVIVQAHSGITRDEFLSEKDATVAFLGQDATDIDGVGDAAYEMQGFIYAHKGSYELVMTNILGFNANVPEEAAQALEINTALMQDALARLP